ncbi:hypothetical protein LguiA_026265 [Lonicera macranthoides]
MPVRDAISWNSIVSRFLRSGKLEMGFEYFKRMHDSGIYCLDQASLTTVLSSCDGSDFLYTSKMIHGLVFLTGFEPEITVGNALITSYFNCGCFKSGRQVFDEMIARNVITWTAVISGLAQNQFFEESLKLFMKMRCGPVDPNSLTYLSSLSACSGFQALEAGCQIHGLLWKLGIQSDLHIESALMDLYSKCGSLGNAWQVFESAEVFDEVSMTMILVGFAQNGFEEEAVQVFIKMVKSGIDVDPNMVSAVLGVFGIDTSLSLGKQIHSLTIKKCFGSNPFVSNGLINMYSKCGDLEESMKSEGVEPTDVTFISLLHACSHVGLLDKGMEFLESMETVYGLSPRMEHYACIVDMLGRAGRLTEAKSFIEKLLVKAGILVWQALLGACSIYGDTEMGKYAANELSLASPDSPSPYILMANIYSSKGKWKERAKTIKRMKEMGVAKETGISWIEVEKRVHSFVVDDIMHPQGELIYGVLLELFLHTRDEGSVPDKMFILYYLDQEETEDS